MPHIDQPTSEATAAPQAVPTSDLVSLRLASQVGRAVTGRLPAENGPVLLHAWSHSANQLWKLIPEGDHVLMSMGDSPRGYLFATNEPKTVVETTVQPSDKAHWTLEPKGDGYQIVSQFSGLCIRAEKDALVQAPRDGDGTAADVWLLTREA